MTIEKNNIIETHPWEPFIPEGARILIMGTFPPGLHRWSMNFYYPNPTNDFWRIMSLIFLGDKDALYDKRDKRFDIEAVKHLASSHRIALNDTGHKVRRLMGNASDKYLEIVEPVNLKRLLERMPLCKDIATTGEKAADIIARLTDTDVPKMGQFVQTYDGYRCWRMPSTSRAYPMKLEEKAKFYEDMFRHIGIK